jgi:hypothetical protein
MKKIISIFVLNILFLGICVADMSIGRCSFYGERPPHSMSFGNTIVYYHEMSSSSISRGGVEYKQCTGNVWVIYRSALDTKRLQFQTTNGSVQTCYDY